LDQVARPFKVQREFYGFHRGLLVPNPMRNRRRGDDLSLGDEKAENQQESNGRRPRSDKFRATWSLT